MPEEPTAPRGRQLSAGVGPVSADVAIVGSGTVLAVLFFVSGKWTTRESNLNWLAGKFRLSKCRLGSYKSRHKASVTCGYN